MLIQFVTYDKMDEIQTYHYTGKFYCKYKNLTTAYSKIDVYDEKIRTFRTKEEAIEWLRTCDMISLRDEFSNREINIIKVMAKSYKKALHDHLITDEEIVIEKIERM